MKLPDGFLENHGTMPGMAEGKRVRVILRGTGAEPVYDDKWNPMSPPGWAADGRGGCRWSLTGHPFDIVGYRIL